MKTKSILKLLIAFFCLFSTALPTFSHHPVPYPVPKEQQKIQKAEETIALHRVKMATFDSIISVSNSELELALDSLDILFAQRKVLDKEYEKQRKPLYKLAKSNNKADVLQAKTDLKALNTGYNSTCKEIDNRLKINYLKTDKYSLQIIKAGKSMEMCETKIKASNKIIKEAKKSAAAKEKQAAKGSKTKK